MEKVILIRCGELTLKGLNRKSFEAQLKRNIKQKLSSFPEYTVTYSQSRFYVQGESEEFEYDEAIKEIIEVPGIVSVSLAYMTKSQIEDIQELTFRLLSDKLKHIDKRTSFKVNTRRGDKTFEYDSQQVNKLMGGYILDNFPDKLFVDVFSPQITIYIEVRENTYIYTDKINAVGGLPVGSGGRAMLLLSGGIDSPVAGYMVSKRGVKIEAIHFYSYPYTSERAKMKVIELAKLIGHYNNGIVLHVISFTDIQVYLKDNFDKDYLTIIMRRVMMKIAETVSKEANCTALITGESIGQVASQTLESLNVVNKSVDMLVLRPLAGVDKNDIVDTAKKIGTFETSILPYEDCCTIFVAKHPKTKPKIQNILDIESKYVNMEELINTAVNNREIIKL